MVLVFYLAQKCFVNVNFTLNVLCFQRKCLPIQKLKVSVYVNSFIKNVFIKKKNSTELSDQ